ncbi:hypothetical protein L7F22_000998 [Adiantum nelumboides]|nr:hypothetical protein [Adiantum nelumboides]
MEIGLCMEGVVSTALREGGSGRHVGCLLMCATTAATLGILHMTVQAQQPCETTVDFQVTQQLSVPMILPIGIPKRQDTNSCSNEAIYRVSLKSGHIAKDCGSKDHLDTRLCKNYHKVGHLAVDCKNEKACNNCRKIGQPCQRLQEHSCVQLMQS